MTLASFVGDALAGSIELAVAVMLACDLVHVALVDYDEIRAVQLSLRQICRCIKITVMFLTDQKEKNTN